MFSVLKQFTQLTAQWSWRQFIFSANPAPRSFSNSNKIKAEYFKVAQIQILYKESQNFSGGFEEVKREMGDSSCWQPAESHFAGVKGLQAATQPSTPPLCLPAPQHSPCSAPGFSSQFPFPPGVAPSSAVHLRSSQATWEVGAGAVVGLPG